MNSQNFVLLGLAVAILVLTLARISDGQSAAGQGTTVRYSIHAVGLDGGRSIAWILDQWSGKVKACGITYGGPKPECTPEDS